MELLDGVSLENNSISTIGSFVCIPALADCYNCCIHGDLFSSWKIADIFIWYCNLVNGTFVIILQWINLHLTHPNTSFGGKDWFGPLSTLIIRHQIVKNIVDLQILHFFIFFYSPNMTCPLILASLRRGCYLLNIADKISVTLPQFNLDKVLSHPSHLLRIRVPDPWLVEDRNP